MTSPSSAHALLFTAIPVCNGEPVN